MAVENLLTRAAGAMAAELISCRCVELYSGIGGFAFAVRSLTVAGSSRPALEIESAWDIDQGALAVYRLNFPDHPVRAAEIRSLAVDRLRADLWWLSPPCLPFTRKGKQRDDEDPRTESLLALIGRVTAELPYPESIVIENVPPFAESRTAARVCRQLESAGFACEWELRCPSEFGWPMRRLRSYLIASRRPLCPQARWSQTPIELGTLIDRSYDADPSLAVPREWLEKYRSAIDLVDPDDPACQAACFTSSYGRTPVRSGSYLRLRAGEPLSARFFSPDEVLRMLGFPSDFCWPQTLSTRRRWALAGNSLSLPVVRQILARLPLATSAMGASVATT